MLSVLSLTVLFATGAHADSSSSFEEICPDECIQILHNTGEVCSDESGSFGTIYVVEEWVTVFFDANAASSVDPNSAVFPDCQPQQSILQGTWTECVVTDDGFPVSLRTCGS